MLNEILNNQYLIPGIALLSLICIIVSIVSICMTAAIRGKYKKILVDGAGKDITEAIINYYQKCSDMQNEFSKADKRIKTLEDNIKICGQKIGCYRYSAFDEGKANLSFVIAVLDAENTGFVLDGVYSRQQTTTYMKPIEKGKSKYELTEEEQEAIQIALYNYEKQMKTEQEDQL